MYCAAKERRNHSFTTLLAFADNDRGSNSTGARNSISRAKISALLQGSMWRRMASSAISLISGMNTIRGNWQFHSQLWEFVCE